MENRRSAVWQGPGLTGDGNMVILPVRRMLVLTMMRCVICWLSKWFLQIPRNGSTQG